MHPVRAAKRAVTPKPVRQMRRAMHPVDNAIYNFERELNTKPRQRSTAPAYTHPGCSVRHRTPDAASRCRNR